MKNYFRLYTSLLNETPKSGLGIPDHFVDGPSNHMLLTPIGQRQVLNREKLVLIVFRYILSYYIIFCRRFDYSNCIKDDPKAPTRSYELGIAVKLTTSLAQKLNELSFVQKIGDHYSQQSGKLEIIVFFVIHVISVIGAIARKVMYPPVPNLDPNATVPAYSARIIRSPPLLRLRVI